MKPEPRDEATPGAAAAGGKVRVWDLPTRLFHWSLVALIVVSVVTAKIGGNAMDWHMRSGYALLTLVLFRILWGLAGDRHALFAAFPPSPKAAFAYLRSGGRSVGHSPLAAWSVYALLAALLLQAATGLFANDAIFTEGPLAKRVSNATSDFLTRIHHLNEWTLWLLIGLHLAAVAFYFFVRRDNLVLPMLVGDKHGIDAPAAQDDWIIRTRAALFLALAAGLVAYIVGL